MRIRNARLMATVPLLGTVALSQVFEVYGEYSYPRFNPTLASSGLNNRSFNKGGGGTTFHFAKYLGIKGELMGYGSTSFTTSFTSAAHLPNGATIPPGTYDSKGNMFTYLFGPVIKIPIPKITPFTTQHPVSMAFGGGLDISVSKRVAIRPIELDYGLTSLLQPTDKYQQSEQLPLLRENCVQVLAKSRCN